MESNEYIPPPVTEENKAEYFEELSNFKKADEWIKKYSVTEETKAPDIKILSVAQKEHTRIAFSTIDLIFSFCIIGFAYMIVETFSNNPFIVLAYGLCVLSWAFRLRWKYFFRKKLLLPVDLGKSL
tara:strand:+ start:1735 stop:2112 length:378 start_codon:yes stop_codon:yes gene_type:complete